MKPNLFFALLMMLIFVSNVGAINEVADDNSNLNPSTESSVTAELVEQPSSQFGDTENTLSWPAIPGESLNDIARAFYPKSSVMRRLFISRTLRLNTQFEPKLNATTVFEEPTLLTIPTLKSLSKSRQAINAANRVKANNEKLSMSYSMNKTMSNLPALLLQEYESLVSKNAFLKAELERLHAKIDFLQNKLSDLKLVLDKTLRLSSDQTAKNDLIKNESSNDIKPKPETAVADDSAKKVFKNLNENPPKPVNAAANKVKSATKAQSQTATIAKAQPQASSNLVIYFLWAVLAAGLLLALAAYALNKHRQKVFTRFNRSIPPMDDTLTDYEGVWQDTEQELNAGNIAQQTPVTTNVFVNTEMRVEQAQAVSTLEEAKLLMSINRTQDAIAHLKSIIEAQPKTAINHWLYLLEIFRKLNLKADFESYAKSLHLTFNVMTPIWYAGNATSADANIPAKIIVPQHLEDFPHIMEKLDAVWPSELARVYLESLITDNRDGERAGFSQSALDEILLLIDLLDARKALEAENT